GTAPSPQNSVLVQFTLVPEGDGTRLRVVESGIETTSWPAPERERYVEDHRRGWQGALESLATQPRAGGRWAPRRTTRCRPASAWSTGSYARARRARARLPTRCPSRGRP